MIAAPLWASLVAAQGTASRLLYSLIAETQYKHVAEEGAMIKQMSQQAQPYTIAGAPQAPAIVFVHGAAFTRAMWQPQLAGLADAFHVAAFDLPAHGSRAAEPFTLDSALASLDEAVAAVGGCAVVVGLSLGGYVTMAYAAAHPARVAGLVLCGCAIDYRLWGRLSAVDARLSLRLLGEQRLRQLQERTLRQMLPAAQAERQLAAGFYFRAMPAVYHELARHDFRRLMRQFSGPVLIVTGEGDRLNRRATPKLVAATKQGRTAVIPQAGHGVNLEQPERFNALVRGFALSARN